MLRLFLGILCSLAPAFGQSATGTLEGRVTDATGAVINQAKVTIRNARTNVQQEVTTNESGLFTQPYLVPGSYDVLVESTGFRRYEQKGIGIQVQQTVRVDVQLEIGELSNTVEVQASTAQLSVSNATLSTVIGNKAIQDLPLNGRNPFALATLTPGVVPGPGSTPWISGGRNASSEITIDGTSVILPENNVGINTLAYTPPVDSVEEFSVVTNSLAAEYGRTGGGVINVATRSGTNQLHFSLYDYLRNSKLDANNFFSNRSGGRLGAFQRNQFGGTVGGPVRIPGLYNGTDKTFFFFSEQSTRTRSQSVFNTTVPLPEWLQGDFSNLRTAAGQPITIYDPLTGSLSGSNWIRSAFPGNRIPANRIDPVAARLRTYYPTPNTAPVNVNTQANNYTVSSKGKSGDDRFDGIRSTNP